MSSLDLESLKALCDAATPGPWWIEENEQVWVLQGVHAVIPPQLDGAIPEQVINHQILKAPKMGTPYAEYWPSRADAEFIVRARTDMPALIAEVERLRAKLADCQDRPWVAERSGW